MDAPEDREVKLQKAGFGMLEELQECLPKFLYISSGHDTVQQPRRLVRRSTTAQLIRLLEPFQEWPQLLDPHLAAILTPLTNTFLKSMRPGNEGLVGETSDHVWPLNRAICKILYTICKIRGPKTVTRFFQNEARHLEPMLDALQALEQPEPSDTATGVQTVTWEEKYIYLLWLSHLLFTPFDLSTVGSSYSSGTAVESGGLSFPQNMPPIARRLVEESLVHLSSPSKEREGAVRVLIRLALRADMLKLGLHATLIQWSLLELDRWFQVADTASPYAPIGFLSFLAGMISSADARTIFPFLLPIFKSLKQLGSDNQRPANASLSAVARKVIIKVYRAIILAALQIEALPGQETTIHITEYTLEDVIEHLLTSMADKDTPVRYAASKALSMITIKLDAALAAEITEAVVGSLGENVLWEPALNVTLPQAFGAQRDVEARRRDLSAVNPLRWHGLTLALSQLLFQRSPPPSQLPLILNSLILTLNFEQRGSSGTSIGANVRDAANFGVWSLSRRYNTKELSQVEASSIERGVTLTSRFLSKSPSSVIQILALELVQAACLDPSGNIRRGSSAALQELIGRHPDEVVHGISIVQIVDYHAVALRQRAFESVAVSAAKLHPIYWDSLLDQLLGWRGIAASDAPSRRYAARTIGSFSGMQGYEGWNIVASSVWACINKLGQRDVEKRHGLLLALEAVIDTYCRLPMSPSELRQAKSILFHFCTYFEPGSPLKDRDLTMSTLRPELTAEAVCAAISALAMAMRQNLTEYFPQAAIQRCFKIVELCMGRQEDVVLVQVSKAADNLLSITAPQQKTEILKAWTTKSGLHTSAAALTNDGIAPEGLLSTLGAAYSTLLKDAVGLTESEDVEIEIWETLISGLSRKYNSRIEIRTAALKSMTECITQCKGRTFVKLLVLTLIEAAVPEFVLKELEDSLEDYTVDQRGDIGSLIRLGAIDVVQTAIDNKKITARNDQIKLLIRIITLTGDRLDKVRLRAWKCTHSCLRADRDLLPNPEILSDKFSDVNSISTTAYYEQLIALVILAEPWMATPALCGIITSAGTASESVLRASRLALATHLSRISVESSQSLAHFLHLFSMGLHSALKIERLRTAALETLAYALQTNTVHKVTEEGVDWRDLFKRVQEAHIGTTIIGRLLAAIDVYIGMCKVKCLEKVAKKKLTAFLGHRYPKVRNAAADAIYGRFQVKLLETVDWSGPVKELKDSIEKVREALEQSPLIRT